MIVVSPGTVLAPSPYPTSLDLPVIGWRNVVTASGITAGTAAAGHPAANLANPSTAVYWEGASAAAQTLTITPGAEPCDYLGIARHTLGAGQHSITIDALPGPGEDRVVLAEQILADDRPIIFRFTRQYFSDVRILLGAGLAAPQIADVYVGRLTIVPGFPPPGFTPLPFGIVDESEEGKSESGDFLGRLITGQSLQSEFQLRGVDPAWVRDEFKAFQREGRNRPFFFAWSPEEHPTETGFAWLRNSAEPRFDVDWADVTLEMSGIA